MGVFNRLFAGYAQDEHEPQHTELAMMPQSYKDCIMVVRIWCTDPDIDVSDPALQAAMNTYVSCPACNASYYFSEAMYFTGTSIQVKCPRCEVDPSLIDFDESYDGAWT